MHVTRVKRLSAVAAAALFAAAALAGCSSSSSSSTTAASSTPAGGTATTASPASTTDTGTFAQAPGTLVFGTVPDQANSDSNWKPLEDYIAKETGLKVVFYPTSDYTALIAAAVAGKVDVASFSGLTYVQAENKGAKQAVASSVIASPGLTDPGYYSEAMVPAGSSIKTLAQFKGHKLCFVDPNSTSGFLFPLLDLKKAGVSVTSSGTDASGNPTFPDFTAFFAGAHDKSVQAISSKQCDAGFAEDAETDPAAKAGKVTVLNKQYVPGGPLTYSTTLPADVQAKLKTILSSVSLSKISATGITLTSGFKSSFYGVKPETDAYYDQIRQICSDIPAAGCAPKP